MKRTLALVLTVAFLLSLVPTSLLSITATAATNQVFTITYHLDGGTNALKNPDVYTEEDTITLKDATKEGYNFAGWFLDAGKIEQISEISGRTGNLNLYANFTPKSYTATFQDSVTLTLKAVGFEDKIIYLNYGEIINLYSDSIMSTYLDEVSYSNNDPNFSGWFLDAAYKNRVSSSLEITTDTTLYCHFNNKTSKYVSDVFGAGYYANTYNNTYYNTFGSATDNVSIRVPTLSGGQVTVRFRCNLHHAYAGGPTTYSGGSFKIWNESKGGYLCYEEFPGGKDNPTGYVSTTINVTPGQVIKITYNGPRCGGCDECSGAFFLDLYTTKASVSIKSSSVITSAIPFAGSIIPPSPNNRNGYSFLGWYDEQGNLMLDTYQYTEDQAFVPKWQPTNYYITYNLNGGTNDLTNPSYYTIEDTIVLKSPTKPGYTFKGWYLDSNFNTQITSIAKQTGNVALYARWEVNSYNLTLDANYGIFAPKVTFISDGTEIQRCYLYAQDTLTAYRPANKDGYIFAGWYLDASCTNLFDFNGMITEDVTLYAKWMECAENVINIEDAERFDVSIGGKTEQLYAFIPLVDGTIRVTSESDSLDLYGILYDATKNKLITADDISDSNLDFSYTYNVKAGQLYYIAVKGNTASTRGEAMISIDWTGSCTITGTTYPNKQVTVVYDADYQLPQKLLREGYVFLGWFDVNGVQITDGKWNFITDKTLTAKWESVVDHIHSYNNIWSKFDGNQHIRECMCGEVEYADHEWNNGTITTQPTHTTEGVRTYTCSVCNSTKTESISKLSDHIFGAWSKYDDAQHIRECECGDAEYADHTFGAWEVTVQPTCTTVGAQRRECDHCDHYEIGEVSALGHVSEKIKGYAPTCEKDGLTDGEQCSVCSEILTAQQVIPATGHNYKLTKEIAPTCTENGKKVYTCANCSDGYEEVIDAPGHVSEEIKGYAPTCEENGLADGEQCSFCGEILVAQEIIPAIGHNYKAEVTAPDCVNGGYTTYTCAACDNSYVADKVPATGHIYDDIYDAECNACGFIRDAACKHDHQAVVTAPDCLNGGYTTYICSKCGDSYVADYTAALGHTYDSDLDADCNVCGDVRIISGISGDCIWTLDGTHLTISGNGKMLDYSSSSSIPWYGKTITSVTLESGVTSIGKGAFYNCRFLTSVTIPDSVTSIGDYAFNHCSSLISVTIPDSVTAIGFAAFNTCESLTSVTIPDSVTAIGDYTFGACESLRSVTISNSVTSIGERAFGGCYSLTSVTIPDSVTSIGDGAFGWCFSLTAVTIPDSVTSIGSRAFYECSALTDVYYNGSKADRANISVGDYNDYLLNATWHYAVCSHEYVGDVTTPATCVNTGVMTYTCSDCGDTYTESIPALGHSYKAEVTAPDCVNGGYTTYTCANCGDSYVTDETAALGHLYDSDQDPDCNICGAVREVVIILYGDINGDGKVNNRDLGLLQQHLNGWGVTIDLVSADVNNDGKVNNRDLGLLQQYLNGWGVTLG